MTKFLTPLVASILLLAGTLFAHDITLTWPLSDDPSVTGYKIVYSQIGQTTTNVWRVGKTNIATISNLVSATNIVYSFTATATNSAGVESLPSMVLLLTIPPHSVKYPRFVGRSGNSFTVAWLPSDEADAKTYKVTYGTLNPTTVNVVMVAAPTTLVTVTNGLVVGADHYFDFTVINNQGVESWPKFQLRDKLLPAGPPDLKVTVLVE